MNCHIKSATIIDPGSPFHLQQKDILIQNGIIKSIGHALKTPSGTQVLEASGAFVSTGWIDTYANLGDPGFEQKENIVSGLKAAAAGGFTRVCVMPVTQPVIQTKGQLSYVLSRAEGQLCSLLPLGAITVNHAGKELAELYDMQEAGAVAFSDGPHPVQHAGLMLRALQYATRGRALLYAHADEDQLSPGAQMHEGEMAVRLGMKGFPAMAEELLIIRDLYLAEYTGAPIHFPTISTRGAVNLIREAKKKGIDVSCGVNPVNLLLDETALSAFDENLKLNPPLRTPDDVQALREGIADGTIDMVCSAHQPQNIELKAVEYEYASFGMINLQTCFSIACTALHGMVDATRLVEILQAAPARRLGLKETGIREEMPANLTVFSTTQDFVFTREGNYSISANTSFFGKPLKGRVLAVFHNNQQFIASI